ncbi:MAG: hypothetical protein KBG01_02780 [Syntrophobacterales bacterium]|jgi:hypothetical protein|nr:hypothetical protein [Syntrophobacterales bacterium]
MKVFGAGGGVEEEKRALIERLKTVKDPFERERILWTLEGMKKSVPKTRSSREAGKEPPAAEEKVRLPVKLPKGFGSLTQYAAPVVFIFFGLAFILQAVLRGLQKKDFASETGQFVGGAIFLLAGFASLQKAKKTGRVAGGPGERA